VKLARGRLRAPVARDQRHGGGDPLTIPRERLEALEADLRAALAGVQILLGSSGSCLAGMREQSVHASPGKRDDAPGSTMIDAPQTSPQPLLLSPTGVAELLGCNPRTLRRWRQQRGFPRPISMGRSGRWRRAEIERWLEERSR
jgi:predicted DNA-binding transcriptional regulator AlpA